MTAAKHFARHRGPGLTARCRPGFCGFEWIDPPIGGLAASGKYCFQNRDVWGAPMASAYGAGREWPADPVAQGLAHDEPEVAALEPRQFLGEQCRALPP